MFVGCGCHCREENIQSSIIGVSGADNSSYSVSSFGSSIADPPGRYPYGGCNKCLASVASQVYEVEWIYNGQPADEDDTRPCCDVYRSQSKFFVYRNERPDTIGCVWISRENAHLELNRIITGRECLEVNNRPELPSVGRHPRVSLQFVDTGDNFPGGPVEFRRDVRIHFFYTYFSAYDPANPFSLFITQSDAVYKLIKPSGEQYQPGEPVPCLQPMTFKRQLIQSLQLGAGLGPGWSGGTPPINGIWRGAPCKQVRFSGFDLGLPEFVSVVPVQA